MLDIILAIVFPRFVDHAVDAALFQSFLLAVSVETGEWRGATYTQA